MKEKSINPFPEVSTEGLKDQPHGPLISFSYNLSSNGMMAGSGSYGGDELSWNKDGSITLTSKYNGGGKSVRTEYRVKPEPAAKMRDYVAEKHLAALAEKEIPTPMVYDNFTSSSFSMTFDDSALGGIPYKKCTVNCGPAGMTFRSIEEKLRAILKECRETGELIYTHEKEAGGAFAGFPGFAGMTTGTPASGSQPGPVPAKPAEPQPGCWTCTKCGFTGNRGRFCSECGSSR